MDHAARRSGFKEAVPGQNAADTYFLRRLSRLTTWRKFFIARIFLGRMRKAPATLQRMDGAAGHKIGCHNVSFLKPPSGGCGGITADGAGCRVAGDLAKTAVGRQAFLSSFSLFPRGTAESLPPTAACLFPIADDPAPTGFCPRPTAVYRCPAALLPEPENGFPPPAAFCGPRAKALSPRKNFLPPRIAVYRPPTAACRGRGGGSFRTVESRITPRSQVALGSRCVAAH